MTVLLFLVCLLFVKGFSKDQKIGNLVGINLIKSDQKFLKVFSIYDIQEDKIRLTNATVDDENHLLEELPIRTTVDHKKGIYHHAISLSNSQQFSGISLKGEVVYRCKYEIDDRDEKIGFLQYSEGLGKLYYLSTSKNNRTTKLGFLDTNNCQKETLLEFPGYEFSDHETGFGYLANRETLIYPYYERVDEPMIVSVDLKFPDYKVMKISTYKRIGRIVKVLCFDEGYLNDDCFIYTEDPWKRGKDRKIYQVDVIFQSINLLEEIDDEKNWVGKLNSDQLIYETSQKKSYYGIIVFEMEKDDLFLRIYDVTDHKMKKEPLFSKLVEEDRELVGYYELRGMKYISNL